MIACSEHQHVRIPDPADKKSRYPEPAKLEKIYCGLKAFIFRLLLQDLICTSRCRVASFVTEFY